MGRGRSFWRWLVLWIRAGAMEDARRKMIMRENLETWNRDNRAFIEKCNREDANRIYNPPENESGGSYGCDYSSTVGSYGCDCGDASV